MSDQYEINEPEGGGDIRRRRRKKPRDIDYSSRKPWWLVFLMVVALLIFSIYIRKTNTTEVDQGEGFWAFLTNKSIETDSVTSTADTLRSWGSTTPQSITDNTSHDSLTVDEWDTTPIKESSESTVPVNQESTTDEDFGKNVPQSDPVSTNAVASYYIIAGEFKDKNSATKRMQEIRQGNYPAKILEPVDQNGMYRVSAGEFKNLKTAQSKAEALSFILEIKTKVEKKD